MNIFITGGTGFIGTRLRQRLLQDGHYLAVVTRSPGDYEGEVATNQRFMDWDSDLTQEMERADAVINLAGSPIFGRRWTEEVKKTIHDSRIESTRKIVSAIQAAEQPPELMVSASAVGYYGDRGEDRLTEEAPPGDTFLSRVCQDWEAAAREVTGEGVRLAIPRMGIVLGEGGGALEKMLTPFRLFIGGPIGDGEQYFPWIHREDVCRGLLYPFENEDFKGAYNLSAPNPVKMEQFADKLGEVLNRPSIFRVPEFILKIVLGEAAEPMLDSLRVEPKKLQESGFQFHFKELKVALADIL